MTNRSPIKCGDCGYEWKPRRENPSQCPNCNKRLNYNPIQEQEEPKVLEAMLKPKIKIETEEEYGPLKLQVKRQASYIKTLEKDNDEKTKLIDTLSQKTAAESSTDINIQEAYGDLSFIEKWLTEYKQYSWTTDETISKVLGLTAHAKTSLGGK